MAKLRLPWRIGFWLLLLVMSGAGYAWWKKTPTEQAPQKYKTEAIDRGDIVQSITANGTLNPVVVVNVGTQISGTIQKLHVNFNDQVSAGQILAELDPSLLNAAIKQSEASLASAEANVRLAQTKETRARTLVTKGFVVQSQLDEAVHELAAARAQVKVVKAQAERDQANLRYGIIRSPISGIVIARPVDLGQTVAASFQTPTLFQIAQDLKVMQIDTSVAEADIGRIKVDQEVKFSVDAFPDKHFKGRVRQIRLNPSIQQNVVTYNVVIAADNAEGSLLPGMTAHVQINTQRREAVLRAVNSALRFKPNSDEEPTRGAGPKLYKLMGDNAIPVSVKTGIADNLYTEIVSGDVREGDAVITRQLAGRKAPGEQAPFRFRVM
ncbi:MAG: efflux RND transporter periplasmic adaptor subunit [Burkholderiales bacterium]